MTPPLTMFGMSGPVSKSTAAVASTEDAVEFKNASDYSHVRFDKMNVPGTRIPTGLFISPDGTKFYTVDSADRLRQQTLSTPYDISTHGSVTATIATGASNGNDAPTGIFFKPDGTYMWITDADDYVYYWSLSTAWDISSASYVGSKSFTAPHNTMRGPFWKPDGTKFFAIDPYYDRVYSYTPSTAWDITSINVSSYTTSALLDVSPISEGAAQGQFWSNDGTKFYYVGATLDQVSMWNVSAWDVTGITGAPDSTLSISSFETAPYTICFSENGKHMYIGGADGDGVDQFTRN